MTVPANRQSWGLTEWLGMIRSTGEDFDHSRVVAGDPLCRHIVYRLPRQAAGIVA